MQIPRALRVYCTLRIRCQLIRFSFGQIGSNSWVLFHSFRDLHNILHFGPHILQRSRVDVHHQVCQLVKNCETKIISSKENCVRNVSYC